MGMELLSEPIRQALKKKDWGKLTEPQMKAIPVVLSGKNLILIAPTGLGKTEAVALPLFQKLLKGSYPPISLIYITPLRALNRDMLHRMRWFGKELGIVVAVRHGDTPKKERLRLSKSPPDMLITTPETFQIMFTGKHLREHLKNVRWVVVDEVHELAQDERGAQLAVGLERLGELTGREVQRIGLSATVGSPKEIGKFLVGMGREIEIISTISTKKLEINVESPVPDKEDEEISEILNIEQKQSAGLRRAKELIRGHRSTLFFVNTRDMAETLAARFKLWDEAFPIGVHHGSLSKGVRIQMEDDFKLERIKALICTSSLELGIDVGSTDFTLQYNSPREVTRLVQRIGRAGHKIGEVSRGLILATSPDDITESLAITRRALSGELELARIRENPLSVLANQILAITISNRRNNIAHYYSLIKRAYPFRNLKLSDYMDVLHQLQEERTLWVDGKEFGRRRSAFSYFYDNISMIPDEKNFKTIDATTRSVIGTLDERFVASYIQPHSRLIIKGSTWEVVEVQEDGILLSPAKVIGAVPNWVGEEIPVPFEVAQEVGRIRRTRDLKLYHPDQGAKAIIKKHFKKQAKIFPVPNDQLITIEHDKKTIIVNACLGSRVNETLGQLISILLAARIGESIGIRTDPYRIILELPTIIDPKIVKDLFINTSPHSIEPLLKVSLKNSSYMRWIFIHVARKFCAIEKDADYRQVRVSRIIDAFEDTPLYNETIEKILWEKMDLDRTKQTLKMIQKGVIKIEITGLSPIGLEGLDAFKALTSPQKPDRVILMTLKKRIENEKVKLICLKCKRSITKRVASISERVTCPVCDAKLVTAVHPYEDVLPLLKKKKPVKSEQKKIKALYKSANLIMRHGKKAVLALRARGIGPGSAARILSGYYETEEEFLRELFSAELQYARTRRFW